MHTTCEDISQQVILFIEIMNTDTNKIKPVLTRRPRLYVTLISIVFSIIKTRAA